MMFDDHDRTHIPAHYYAAAALVAFVAVVVAAGLVIGLVQLVGALLS